ncbi:MAG: formate--tetrahydrofolate ligase [Beijerinckiaceae bacterium]
MPEWDEEKWDAARLYDFAAEAMGFGTLPVRVAKTRYSFSADVSLLGARSGHVMPGREVRLTARAPAETSCK